MASAPKFPVSLEFFPGRTAEGADKIRAVRRELYALAPDFCSVTYGAGGSTQEGTFGAVAEILRKGSRLPRTSRVSGPPRRACVNN